MRKDDASLTGPVQQPLVAPASRGFDPRMSLALSTHASPGVYALLLGAGISLASGVQTGWGIVQDLVSRIAAMQDPEDPAAGAAAMADPEGWWAQHHEEPLGYSALLAAVAPTPAARQAQLAGYFQPGENDEPGAKGPTDAHRAIAQLVKRGTIRVILTTNFDRLMEQALQETGISPQVIHTAEQIDAMMPLAHCPATVIKLHGDYADLEQRNTVDELESYPQAQQQLLERVLEEYGLIVCGWSAEWDKALAKAVEGTRSRRYPLFWCTYGAPGQAAAHLIAQHNAAVIAGMSADELFTDLLQRIEALDSMAAPPLTREMAVVQLKRALPDPVRRIEVFDLVDQAVTGVVDGSAPERRPVNTSTGASWPETFVANLNGYRADSDLLLHLVANGVFHDDRVHEAVWQRVTERLVRLRDTTPGFFNEALEHQRHLPALLATWTMGVAAVLAKREEILAGILTRPMWSPPYSGRDPSMPAHYLNPVRVMDADSVGETCRPADGGRYRYPQSHWLKDTLREPFGLVEPNEATYRSACSRFEFLASMIAMDTDDDLRALPWAGEFLLESTWGYEGRGLAATIQRELTPTWPLLQAGAFGGDLARAEAAYRTLTAWRTSYGRW